MLRASVVCILAASAGAVMAQVAQKGFTRVETGLDEAVKWKWAVEGTSAPEPPRAEPAHPAAGESAPALANKDSYTVQKGDALAKIARKFQITVEQLKLANALQSDMIHIGDVLRIPGPEEIAKMPKPTPKPGSAAPVSAQPMGAFAAEFDPDALLFQIYLDHHNFSPGPIDGANGLRFQKTMFAFQSADPSASDLDGLRERAKAEVGQLFTSYTLHPDDFRFIAPPKAVPANKKASAAERSAAAYRDMVSSQALQYRTPWEFVAERFHCSPGFLRSLNPTLKSQPSAGTRFRVPNVRPFEIERAIQPPVQPEENPSEPTKAIVADLSLLEIYRGDRMVAAYPISVARPGLRGRGEWVVLDALPMPKMITRRELRDTAAVPDPNSPLPGPLKKDEVLPPGPRNPLGILWINLAKAEDPQPLPFGLHGTSVPEAMSLAEGLGGFRMTNWDIVRAARLLPKGTPLKWRMTIAKPAVPPAAAPAEAAPPAVAVPGTPAQPVVPPPPPPATTAMPSEVPEAPREPEAPGGSPAEMP